MPFPAIDLSGVRTYSLHDRPSRVALDQFITPATPLPPFKNPELAEVAGRLVAARQAGAPVIWMLGGHVVKRGLAPVIIDLMERGLITHLASNGAATIHDFEIALIGQTSEDVASSLADGSFGMAEETGASMNRAIRQGARQGLGIGESLGRWIEQNEFPYRQYSLLSQAYRLGLPYTVHVALGTDIIHQHPLADFAALGWGSGQDFKIFCAAVSQLEGGAFCNFGSAVIGPEVFLKALSIARNLGHVVRVFTTANFDLHPLDDYHAPLGDDQLDYYYRPRKNIVNRPTALGGRGYHIAGDHLATIPNLAALVRAPTGYAQATTSQGLAAPAGSPPAAARLAEAARQLARGLRCGGTLFVLSPHGALPALNPSDAEIPTGHRERLAGLPGGETLAAQLRPGLRLARLEADLYPHTAGQPAEIQLAQALYSLAQPADALLCLCPGDHPAAVLPTVSVARALGLPVTVIAAGPAPDLAGQSGGELLFLEAAGAGEAARLYADLLNRLAGLVLGQE
jgi:hypothetical protein